MLVSIELDKDVKRLGSSVDLFINEDWVYEKVKPIQESRELLLPEVKKRRTYIINRQPTVGFIHTKDAKRLADEKTPLYSYMKEYSFVYFTKNPSGKIETHDILYLQEEVVADTPVRDPSNGHDLFASEYEFYNLPLHRIEVLSAVCHINPIDLTLQYHEPFQKTVFYVGDYESKHPIESFLYHAPNNTPSDIRTALANNPNFVLDTEYRHFRHTEDMTKFPLEVANRLYQNKTPVYLLTESVSWKRYFPWSSDLVCYNLFLSEKEMLKFKSDRNKINSIFELGFPGKNEDQKSDYLMTIDKGVLNRRYQFIKR